MLSLPRLFSDDFQDGTLDQLQRLRIRPMIWSPLAGGALLAGGGETERRVQAALGRIGERHGASAASVAFAWLLRHPSRPLPVAGSRRIEALREAVAALRLTLDAQDWTEVWQAGAGHEVLDLGSTNGTFVAGTRVHSHRLKVGEVATA